VIVFNSPANSDADERSRTLPRTSRFRTHEFEEDRSEQIVSTRHSRFGSDTTQDSDALDIA